MDFRQALNAFTAELTPQPWDYTDNAGTTLTVIPAGLREDPGCAEVIVSIKALAQFFDADASIPSRDLPAMIDALTNNQPWPYNTPGDVGVELAPSSRGGVWLTVSPDLDDDQPQIHVSETLRLHLASALCQALDVARGWEN